MAEMEKDDTRHKLLRAAAHIFAHKGYEAATVRMICAEAGVNLAAVNYHFGSKDKLYAAVLECIFTVAADTALPRWRVFMDGAARPEERLESYVSGMMEWVYGGCGEYGEEECGEMGALYVMEMIDPTPAMQSLIDAYIKPEAEMLYEVVSALLGPSASRGVVWACMGSVVGQMLHYLYSAKVMARLNPEAEPPVRKLVWLSRHITEFSLAGIRAVRAGLEDKR